MLKQETTNKMNISIGAKISPILCNIEDALWDFDCNIKEKPNYQKESLRAASKIFMSVLMDKMWELLDAENISQEDREKMVEKAGQDFRKLIKTYTDVDSHDFYK